MCIQQGNELVMLLRGWRVRNGLAAEQGTRCEFVMWKVTQDVHPAMHGMSHRMFACCCSGNTLLASPEVRKIGFTGSTNVGKMLMKQAADTVKKVGPAELG